VSELIDVREQEEFQADREAIGKARSFADALAGDKPFSSREEAGEAAEAIRGLRLARVDAEKRKLEITAPHRAATEAVNHAYTELLAPVKAAEAALKQKGLTWKRAEEAKAQAAARAEAERRQKEADKALAEAEAARELAAEEPENPEAQQLVEETHSQAAAAAAATSSVPAPAPEAGRARGVGGASLHTRTEWRWELTDLAQVPAEFLTIDPAKVKGAIDAEKAHVKTGAKPQFGLEIPGLRIWPDEIPVSR
jgi:colicin import membrane protein